MINTSKVKKSSFSVTFLHENSQNCSASVDNATGNVWVIFCIGSHAQCWEQEYL